MYISSTMYNDQFTCIVSYGDLSPHFTSQTSSLNSIVQGGTKD